MTTSSQEQTRLACECEEKYRSACVGERFYKEDKGKRYCVFHFPGPGKSLDFKEAFDRKIKKFKEAVEQKLETGAELDFQGVCFPDDVQFAKFVFNESDFTGATFNGEANFYRADFKEPAYFSQSTFNGKANFGGVRFREGVNFGQSTFTGTTDFNYAGFNKEVDFTGARFEKAVIFRDATFGDHVRFAGKHHSVFGPDSCLDLQFARIEKPDRVSFHTLTLRPSWFVNVDARNFRFINVNWDWHSVEEEIETVKKENSSPHLMLSIACRNLAINAEESHYYEDASKLRYRAMDSRRLQNWRGFDPLELGWWYWVASGYGERVLLATVVLLGVLVVSAVFYTRVGFMRWEPKLNNENDATSSRKDEVGTPLPLTRALTYSAAVMTLQKPEPRPATTSAQAIVLLETVFGPVQAALLALAIRRKFMR